MTEMGWTWDPSRSAVLEDWAKWGQARHGYFLRAARSGRAVIAVVAGPRAAAPP